MRRNVLTVGLLACSLTAIWPGSLFGAAPSAAERHDSEQKSEQKRDGAWLWDGMRGPMTLPLGPTWIDLRPDRPGVLTDAGNVH